MKPDKAPELWNELTLASDKVYQLGLMVSGNKLAYNFPFICLRHWLPAVRERSCVVSSQRVCLKRLCYQCKPYLCMGEHEWPNPNHVFHVNFMNFMQNHFPTLKMKEKLCADTTHTIRVDVWIREKLWRQEILPFLEEWRPGAAHQAGALARMERAALTSTSFTLEPRESTLGGWVNARKKQGDRAPSDLQDTQLELCDFHTRSLPTKDAAIHLGPEKPRLLIDFLWHWRSSATSSTVPLRFVLDSN